VAPERRRARGSTSASPAPENAGAEWTPRAGERCGRGTLRAVVEQQRARVEAGDLDRLNLLGTLADVVRERGRDVDALPPFDEALAG
jgi:hypothetical protein